MQTGIKVFDLSFQGARVEGRKVAAEASQKGQQTALEAQAGFLEIMGALMGLKPERWQDSIDSLDADFFGQSTTDLTELMDPDRQDNLPPEMLQFLTYLNGAIETAEQKDQAHSWLDAARAILAGPDKVTPYKADHGDTEWKSKWFQLFENSAGQVEPVAPQDGEPGGDDLITLSTQNDQLAKAATAGADPATDVADIEMEIDTAPKQAPAETTDKDASPRPAQAKADISKPVDDSPQQFGRHDRGDQKQTFATETPKAAPVDKSGIAEPQPMSDVHPLKMESDTQASLSGNETEATDSDSQKPSSAPGAHHGLSSRMEAKLNQAAVQTDSVKEMPPQDKQLQTDIIRQIVQRMSMQTQGAQSKMVIRLKPEFLGDVHMHVVTENHQVTVRMMTDSFAVKEIIEQNLQHLRSEMQHHGLEIQKFDVLVADDNDGWRHGQDQAGFRESLRKRQQRDGGSKATGQNAKTISGVNRGMAQQQKNLSEIDYFA